MAKEKQNGNGDGTPEAANQEITVAGELAVSIKQVDKLIAAAKKKTKGWSTEKAIGHLLTHLLIKHNLCSICCLTKEFFHASKHAQTRMRQRIPVLFTHMLREHGLFLLKDYEPFGLGHHGELKEFGIYDPNTADAHQQGLARNQLRRMISRGQITADDALVAKQITGLLEDATR